MGGQEQFITTKSISKKMKAKGLMKLRFYCQMCQKQCRDANGFKCHCMSDAHQRQMSLFSENSEQFLTSFSNQFKSEFMAIIKQHYPNKRVLANSVYQEYISDPNHVHMNSTAWDTLTNFVKYLHEQNLIEAEETEKGWFITYVSKDSEILQNEASKKKTKRLDYSNEKAEQRALRKQIEVGKLLEQSKKRVEPTELDLSTDRNFGFIIRGPQKQEPKIQKLQKIFEINENKKQVKKANSDVASRAVVEILKEEKEKRDLTNRKDYWLAENLIVKIITSRFGKEFENQKVLVNRVIDFYEAEIELENEQKMEITQKDVETVIPRIGGTVLVVNGSYRTSLGILESLNQSDFSCRVKITTGPFTGLEVDGVKYDDICKIYIQ